MTRPWILRFLPVLYLMAVIVPILGGYGLWFDEIFSVVMSRSIDSIVQMVRTQENNMLLHYLLLWCWQSLGNGSEIFLRSSSVLLVSLSFWPLYAASRRFSNEATANVCCLFYASHFLVLQHTQACRGYSLALLASAIVVWRWIVAWQTGSNRDWLAAGALAGLAVWSHYFAALLLPVLLFAMVWCDGLKQPWRQLFLAGGAFVITALPILLTRPPDGAAQIAWAEEPSMLAVQGTLWMLAGVDGPSEKPLLWLLFACILLVMLQQRESWIATSRWRNPVVGLGIGLVLAVAGILAESFFLQPLFVYRFFTPLVPLFSCVAAVALSLLWPWLRTLLLGGILLASAFETWKPFVVEPVPLRYWWKPMTQQLSQALQPADAILVYPAFLRMPVDYYLDVFDPARHLSRPAEYVSGYYRQGGGMEPEPDWQRLLGLSDESQRVWLIADEKNIPSWHRLRRTKAPDIRRVLLVDHRLAFEQRYGTMSVQRYDKILAGKHAINAP